MSAAEKLVTPEASTRGMGALADCPLARMYKWVPPLQDYHRKKVDGFVNRTDSVLMRVVDPVVHDPAVVARAVRKLNAARVERVLPSIVPPASRENLKLRHTPRNGGRKRSPEVDALVTDYLELCKLPFAKGQLKALAVKHGYRNSAYIAKTLQSRGVWRNRRDGENG